MRVVLDTNTVVSSLLFTGTSSRLIPLWQSRRIVLLATKAIVDEWIRVLGYPKFKLTEEEILSLWQDQLLPFVEAVGVRTRIRAVKRDPDDDKFLECALAGRAKYLVTGDPDLLELNPFRGITILTPGDFLQKVAPALA